MLTEEKTIAVDYVCAQCGAKDRGKFFINDDADPIAETINCVCGAGRGLTPEQGKRKGVGMFPVLPEASAAVN